MVAVVFWLVFIIVIVGVFIANRDTIKKNFDLVMRRTTDSTDQDAEERPEEQEVVTQPPVVVVQPGVSETAAAAEEPRVVDAPVQDAAQEAAQSAAEERPRPAAQTEQPPAARTVETRERNIYFTQVDKDGQILRSRVSRTVAVSDSPMQDALNVLLAGPSAEELSRGIISLIPQNTRIQSILVRGDTAYISFSEDFQFNVYGVEGYAAQIRQIVWTATEFPTVNNVQILIEGRRVDYLGEGIWIGSPVNRQSL